MKRTILLIVLLNVCAVVFAQEGDDASVKGFNKQRLFTGGGVTVSFSNYSSVFGVSPVFGYSVAKWLDAGILFNYTHASDRHVTYFNGSYYVITDDKYKQNVFGPGAFVRIYPVNFLFVQAQGEYNFTSAKYIHANGAPTEKLKVDAPSLLVGAGYCQGREGPGNFFYYLSLMFDIAKDKDSPYTEVVSNGKVNVLPIIKGGIQVPLFQGKGNRR